MRLTAVSTTRVGFGHRTGKVMALLAVLALVLAPALAEARAGRGGSMGSRGARTYQAPPPTQTAPAPARPVERSMTETTRNPAASPASAQPGGALAQAGQGSWFSRNPLMTGLMGGFLGAGLFGLLSGGGLFGGLSGFGGILGLLLQVGLVVLLVRLGLGLLRRNGMGRPAMAGPGSLPPDRPMGGMAREAIDVAPGGGRATGQGPAQPGQAGSILVGAADFQAFEERLHGVQAAWSASDLRTLGRLVTPEMLQYFSEQLSDDASRGVRNEVTDVKLEQGDLAEAWTEGSRQFATVAIRWSAIDLDRDATTGEVRGGDVSQRTEATELWTFLRSGQGGAWMVSAIQQVGSASAARPA